MPYFRLPQANNCWAHTKDFKVMPLSNGVCYRDYFNLPQTAPKVSLPLPDLGNQIEEDAARIEREIQLLRTEPTAFKERDVYMRWIQDGQDLGVHHRTNTYQSWTALHTPNTLHNIMPTNEQWLSAT